METFDNIRSSGFCYVNRDHKTANFNKGSLTDDSGGGEQHNEQPEAATTAEIQGTTQRLMTLCTTGSWRSFKAVLLCEMSKHTSVKGHQIKYMEIQQNLLKEVIVVWMRLIECVILLMKVYQSHLCIVRFILMFGCRQS